MGLTYNPNTHVAVISRGDDLPFLRYTVKNAAGVPYDVSANTFKFTVKADVDDSIADAMFQKQNPAGNGIDLAQANTGIVDVHFAAADTASLAGTYVFDLEMTENGKADTLDGGAFVVRKDVSTPGVPPSPPSVLVPFPGDIQVIGGQIYIKDLGSGVDGGKYWKLTMIDGAFTPSGPSVTVPF